MQISIRKWRWNHLEQIDSLEVTRLDALLGQNLLGLNTIIYSRADYVLGALWVETSSYHIIFTFLFSCENNHGLSLEE